MMYPIVMKVVKSVLSHYCKHEGLKAKRSRYVIVSYQGAVVPLGEQTSFGGNVCFFAVRHLAEGTNSKKLTNFVNFIDV